MPEDAPTDRPDQTGGPDAIWAPWRLRYLESLDPDEDTPKREPEKSDRETPPPKPTASSFLGAYWQTPEDDEQNHVLIRTDEGIILLNAFPYANGHLLVALGEARPRLLDYDPSQRAALWALVDRAADLLERALHPQGVNIGINQGRAAGAGVPSHLHVHLVPRWGGDVNFITTVGQTRVIPGSLDAMWQRFVRVRDGG